MLTFLLQALDALYYGTLHLFMVLFGLIILLWLVRLFLSRKYVPWVEPFDVSTAVVIPVVDEPIDLFDAVLARIIGQKPDEIVVVINGPRNVALETACLKRGVKYLWTDIPGKRNAVAIGVNAVKSDVVLLVDSDTVWTDGTLSELKKPFADPKVGGVTTRQHILQPTRSIWTRWAEWLETVRNAYSMPAMSVLGTVGCLPGRTIAFRRSILVKNMHKFLTEKFLGVFLEVSDDRTLTNYALKDGYKTVYQSTSLVYTDAPTKLRKLSKQQYRWARGSQYNTLRMLPWMLRKAPVLALFYAGDIIVPFLIVGAFMSWFIRSMMETGTSNPYTPVLITLGITPITIGILILGGVVLSVMFAAVRYSRAIETHPANFLWLPFYMFVNIVILVPIRIFGFARAASTDGWGTRAGGYGTDKRKQKRTFSSILTIIPYILTIILLAGSILFGLKLYGN